MYRSLRYRPLKIKLRGAAALEWQRATGIHELPVRSLVPEQLTLPDRPNVLAYVVSPWRLPPPVLKRAIRMLAVKYRRTPREIESDISVNGIPIPVEDVEE